MGMGKTLVMDMGITLVTGVGNYLVTAMGKILDFSKNRTLIFSDPQAGTPSKINVLNGKSNTLPSAPALVAGLA